MPTPPVRTPDQRSEDLAQAVRVRKARKQIKHQMKTGELDISDLLGVGHRGTGDPIVGRLTVSETLRAIPGWGPVKSARLIEAMGIQPRRHLDTLSIEELDRIVAAVRPGA